VLKFLHQVAASLPPRSSEIAHDASYEEEGPGAGKAPTGRLYYTKIINDTWANHTNSLIFHHLLDGVLHSIIQNSAIRV
jgi:hypothetical protein